MESASSIKSKFPLSFCLVALSLSLLGAAQAQDNGQTGPAATSGPPLANGAIYFLPRTELFVRLTRELESCEGDRLQVRQSAEITGSATIEDPQKYYVLSTDSLERFFKSNDVVITQNSTGTLASIKNTSADKTGEFLITVVTALAKVAVVASGFPVGAIPAAAPPKGICNPETLKQLHDLNQATLDIDRNNTTIDTNTKLLQGISDAWKKASDDLTGEIRKLERDLARKKKALVANTSTDDDKYKKALRAEIAKQEDRLAATKEDLAEGDSKLASELKALQAINAGLTEKQVQITASIVKLKQNLTRQDIYRFSPQPTQASLRLDPSITTLRAWFSEAGLNGYKDNVSTQWVCAEDPQESSTSCDNWRIIPRETVAYFGVIVPSRTLAPEYPVAGRDPGGIVFLQPQSAEVRICATRACTTPTGTAVPSEQTGELLLLDRRQFPQFGRVGLIPYLATHMFQTLSVDLELHNDGGIKKLTYTNNARADKAADTFSKTMDEVAKLSELKDKEKGQDAKRKKENIDAETAVYEAELKKLETEKRLKDKRKEFDAVATTTN